MNAARLSIPLVSALVVAAIAAPAQADVIPTVTVSGSDVELVGNDAATVGFGVTKVRDTSRAALAVTSARLRAVIARVTRAGTLAEGDITTGRISVRKVTVHGPGGLPAGTRFRASQGVSVTVTDVKRTGAVVSAGVRAGATNVNGPRFYVSDAEHRYQGALLKAFDQAKEKAQALATRAGRTLGEALSITEGGGVVSLKDTGDSAQPVSQPGGAGAPAAAPVRAGKSRVRGHVTVVFELG